MIEVVTGRRSTWCEGDFGHVGHASGLEIDVAHAQEHLASLQWSSKGGAQCRWQPLSLLSP